MALKSIIHGREELAPGAALSRHRHREAYAILVIRGGFEQDGYAGRLRVTDGDLLIQPTLDAHANRMPAHRGATILRLPWRDGASLGGVHALPDLDAVVRAAEHDLADARHVIAAQLPHARRRSPANDAPDQLAAAIAANATTSLSAWAADHGVARETISRAFSSAFGVSARQFRAELRARAAWLRITATRTSLAEIAASLGFADQAHMTRHVRALTGAPPSAWRAYQTRTRSAGAR